MTQFHGGSSTLRHRKLNVYCMFVNKITANVTKNHRKFGKVSFVQLAGKIIEPVL